MPELKELPKQISQKFREGKLKLVGAGRPPSPKEESVINVPQSLDPEPEKLIITATGFKAVEPKAAEMAERAMQKQPGEKGVASFVKTLWKRSLLSEYFREREFQYSKELLQAVNNDVLADDVINVAKQNAEKRYRDELTKARTPERTARKTLEFFKSAVGRKTAVKKYTLDELKNRTDKTLSAAMTGELSAANARFTEALDESDTMIRREMGEQLHILSEANPEEKKIIGDARLLMREYAEGSLADNEFQKRSRDVWNQMKNLRPELLREADIYATSLFEAAKTLKTQKEHGTSMDVITARILQSEFRIGFGIMGAATSVEASTTRKVMDSVDKLVSRFEKNPLGAAIFNEAVIGSATALVISGTLRVPQTAATNAARAAAGLVGGSAVGGAVAGVREFRRLGRERKVHLREKEMGFEMPKEGSRAWMEQFGVEQTSATDLKNAVGQSIDNLADAQAKINISSRRDNRIGLVGFSSPKNIESERTDLYRAIRDAKGKLSDADKKLLETKVEERTTALNKAMEEAYSKFNKARTVRAAKYGAKAAGAGAIIGAVTHGIQGATEQLAAGTKVAGAPGVVDTFHKTVGEMGKSHGMRGPWGWLEEPMQDKANAISHQIPATNLAKNLFRGWEENVQAQHIDYTRMSNSFVFKDLPKGLFGDETLPKIGHIMDEAIKMREIDHIALDKMDELHRLAYEIGRVSRVPSKDEVFKFMGLVNPKEEGNIIERIIQSPSPVIAPAIAMHPPLEGIEGFVAAAAPSEAVEQAKAPEQPAVPTPEAQPTPEPQPTPEAAPVETEKVEAVQPAPVQPAQPTPPPSQEEDFSLGEFPEPETIESVQPAPAAPTVQATPAVEEAPATEALPEARQAAPQPTSETPAVTETLASAVPTGSFFRSYLQTHVDDMDKSYRIQLHDAFEKLHADIPIAEQRKAIRIAQDIAKKMKSDPFKGEDKVWAKQQRRYARELETKLNEALQESFAMTPEDQELLEKLRSTVIPEAPEAEAPQVETTPKEKPTEKQAIPETSLRQFVQASRYLPKEYKKQIWTIAGDLEKTAKPNEKVALLQESQRLAQRMMEVGGEGSELASWGQRLQRLSNVYLFRLITPEAARTAKEFNERLVQAKTPEIFRSRFTDLTTQITDNMSIEDVRHTLQQIDAVAKQMAGEFSTNPKNDPWRIRQVEEGRKISQEMQGYLAKFPTPAPQEAVKPEAGQPETLARTIPASNPSGEEEIHPTGTSTYKEFIDKHPYILVRNIMTMTPTEPQIPSVEFVTKKETIQRPDYTFDAEYRTNDKRKLSIVTGIEKGDDAVGIYSDPAGNLSIAVADGVTNSAFGDVAARVAVERSLQTMPKEAIYYEDLKDIFKLAHNKLGTMKLEKMVDEQIKAIKQDIQSHPLLPSSPDRRPIDIRSLQLDQLLRYKDEGKFGSTTLGLARYTKATGEVALALKGDTSAMVIKADGQIMHYANPNMSRQIHYQPNTPYKHDPGSEQSHIIHLAQDDTLLVYTDGVETLHQKLEAIIAETSASNRHQQLTEKFQKVFKEGIGDDVFIVILQHTVEGKTKEKPVVPSPEILAATEAAKSGDKPKARQLFEEILEQDENNEEAWMKLASVVETPREQRICLEMVLEINPDNQQAKKALEELKSTLPLPTHPAAKPSPATPPPTDQEARPREQKISPEDVKTAILFVRGFPFADIAGRFPKTTQAVEQELQALRALNDNDPVEKFIKNYQTLKKAMRDQLVATKEIFDRKDLLTKNFFSEEEIKTVFSMKPVSNAIHKT